MMLTKELIGKKLTCFIHENFIEDAMIHRENNTYFILQNICDGLDAIDKRGYRFSWAIDDPKIPEKDGVRHIEIKKYGEMTLTNGFINNIIYKK